MSNDVRQTCICKGWPRDPPNLHYITKLHFIHTLLSCLHSEDGTLSTSSHHGNPCHEIMFKQILTPTPKPTRPPRSPRWIPGEASVLPVDKVCRVELDWRNDNANDDEQYANWDSFTKASAISPARDAHPYGPTAKEPMLSVHDCESKQRIHNAEIQRGWELMAKKEWFQKLSLLVICVQHSYCLNDSPTSHSYQLSDT